VVISGRVQGVFFRAEALEAARRIGEISGWVRNTSDGRVEAVFEGDTADVEEMIRWCQNGSPPARVDDVAVDHQEFKGEFDSFSIRH
jgi:acylphosphatase